MPVIYSSMCCGELTDTQTFVTMARKVVYGIAYPNRMIYIVKDLIGTLNYFENTDSSLIERDFSREEQRDCTIRKQIQWESEIASNNEVNKKNWSSLPPTNLTIPPSDTTNGPSLKIR